MTKTVDVVQKTFGDLLREFRKSKEIQLGTFATMLDITASYLSDVELARRLPFRSDLIRKSAQLLELNDNEIDELLRAASVNRGAIELPVDIQVPESVELSATLMREWSEMTPDMARRVNEFVRNVSRKK